MNTTFWDTTTQRVSEPGVRVYQYVARQPSWIARAAMTAFALVLVIPILLLMLMAIAAAVVVFLLLVAWVRVRIFFAALFGGTNNGSGRRNVEVRERFE